MLSNSLRMNFCYLKNIHILHPRYHPEAIGQFLKNQQNIKCVCVHAIVWLIFGKMKMKMKHSLHIYDINSPRSRYIENIRNVSV